MTNLQIVPITDQSNQYMALLRPDSLQILNASYVELLTI